MSHAITEYVKMLVEGWEDTHRKSQLNLWIMLSLKDGPKHMAEMKEFITALSKGTVTADDKSMYRALRRYHEAELVSFGKIPSSSGPDLKVYELSEIGIQVLHQFSERNIISILYNEQVKQLIMKGKTDGKH